MTFRETAEDRAAELAALLEYQAATGTKGEFVQTEPLEFFDAIFFNEDGEKAEMWEVKIRDRSYWGLMNLGGLFLGANKFMKIRRDANYWKLKALVLLKTKCGLYRKDITGMADPPTTVGGRFDRGDPGDVGLCVLLKDFERVK